jgi:hypothetical protein
MNVDASAFIGKYTDDLVQRRAYPLTAVLRVTRAREPAQVEFVRRQWPRLGALADATCVRSRQR